MRGAVCLFAVLIVALVLKVVQVAGRVETRAPVPAAVVTDQRLDSAVDKLNREFQRQWELEGVRVAEPADQLTVLRRLSLALFGTVSSLEDIRSFETDDQPDRIDRWVVAMLKDSRYTNYFAELLARSLVGVEGGPFIIYRRDRLAAWLA